MLGHKSDRPPSMLLFNRNELLRGSAFPMSFPQAISLLGHLSNSKTLITHTSQHLCLGVSNSVSTELRLFSHASCPLCV